MAFVSAGRGASLVPRLRSDREGGSQAKSAGIAVSRGDQAFQNLRVFGVAPRMALSRAVAARVGAPIRGDRQGGTRAKTAETVSVSRLNIENNAASSADGVWSRAVAARVWCVDHAAIATVVFKRKRRNHGEPRRSVCRNLRVFRVAPRMAFGLVRSPRELVPRSAVTAWLGAK
jgi:hypothetical protein